VFVAVFPNSFISTLYQPASVWCIIAILIIILAVMLRSGHQSASIAMLISTPDANGSGKGKQQFGLCQNLTSSSLHVVFLLQGIPTVLLPHLAGFLPSHSFELHLLPLHSFSGRSLSILYYPSTSPKTSAFSH